VVTTGAETAIVHWRATGGELSERASASFAMPSEGPIVISSNGQQLYLDNVQFETADLSSPPRVFPATVLAADGKVGYALSGLYGIESQARWGQLALPSNLLALSAGDRQLWAYRDEKLYRYTIPLGEGPLANDVDGDGDPLSIELVEPPAHGTVQVTEDGGFRYTPNAGYTGDDGFTYRATDGLASSEPTTVGLQIKALAPTATGDDYLAVESTELEVAPNDGVLANDVDPRGAAIHASLVAGPSHGSLTLIADGSFRYRPNDAFIGEDSFTYRAITESGASRVATVILRVAERNDPPIAVDDQYILDPGATLVVHNPGPRFPYYSSVVRADEPIGYWRLGETSSDVAADETEPSWSVFRSNRSRPRGSTGRRRRYVGRAQWSWRRSARSPR
jgi:hypothetical protein